MFEKANDLFGAYLAGRVGRRELFKQAAALGLTTAAANTLMGAASTRALAADYDWKAHKGTALKLLLNKHPYADAMIADIEAFKSLTGMTVTWDIFPEDVYFDKVTAALSSGASEYDAFMTGAYMTWTYGPAGWVVDLNEYLKNKTAPKYDWEGVLPNLRASTAWSGKAGDALGGPGSKQWCLPWGFEAYSVTYNEKIFKKVGVHPPKNLPEMLEVSAKITKDAGGPYGIGVRGSRSWATIHPGFLSGYTNYGGKDFTQEGGKLKAAMNSPQAKEFTKLWVKMIQDGGPKNWATYTWYQVGTDLGAGASGMIYDADILGYFMDGGSNKEAGHLAFEAFAANPKETEPTSNVWIWSLAMSNYSKHKDATWDFLQWATGLEHCLFGARKMDFVNPIRTKVWEDPEFKTKIGKYPGYLEQYTKTAPKAQIYFTPQPMFFDLTTEWAASLQQMVAKEVPVDEGLDKLAANIDKQLKENGLG